MVKIPKRHPELARTIVESFRPPHLFSGQVFRRFSRQQWLTTEAWLDCSGLAIYFFVRVQELGWSQYLPDELMKNLRKKQERNEERTRALYAEFLRLNQLFTEAEIAYVNLKGFTLSPDSCPHPSLRSQSDLDFLVAEKDHLRAASLLEENGYRLATQSRTSSELKGRGHHARTIDSQYDADLQRGVELHVSRDLDEPENLRNGHVIFREFSEREGVVAKLPSLNAADQFFQQGLHIFHHLRGEHTKLSWLLEFRNHAHAHLGDEVFWEKVALRLAEDADGAIALGMVAHLISKLFGQLPSPLFAKVTSQLPQAVMKWLEMFGMEALLADVPGTKLYLFLESALRFSDHPTSKKDDLRRLIPYGLLLRKERSQRENVDSLYRRLDIGLFRMRFHVKQNLHFMRSLPVWIAARHRFGSRKYLHEPKAVSGNVLTVLQRDDTR